MKIRKPQSCGAKIKVTIDRFLGVKNRYTLTGIVSCVLHPISKRKKRKQLEKYVQEARDTHLLEPESIIIWEKLYIELINSSLYKAFEDMPEFFFTSTIQRRHQPDGMGKIVIDADEPIVICALKDEIERIPVILRFYREVLKVKCFAIIDNGSTDGSKEYLLQQPDVILYEAKERYNSVQRTAWVCRVMEDLGLNHWYLDIDADECFVYPNYEEVSLKEYTLRLNRRERKIVKALLLEVYPKGGLFEKKENCDFLKEYCWFDPDGDVYEYDLESNVIWGGVHKRVFQLNWAKRSKTCLIKPEGKRFPLNAHDLFPKNEEAKEDFGSILLHYKFLPGDMDKITKIIHEGNYSNGSGLYKRYKKVFEEDGIKCLWFEGSKKWIGTASFKEFPFIKDVTK